MSRMHYRPNEFADLAGVSVKTLHRWDSSGKLKPLRTIGGHRYYTDLGLYRFRELLSYKQECFGFLLTIVDKWFPSSKTC